jgi:hypothetical protein
MCKTDERPRFCARGCPWRLEIEAHGVYAVDRSIKSGSINKWR